MTKAELMERIAAMRKDARIVKKYLEVGDDRLLAGEGPAGKQVPELSPGEWGKVYRACSRIIRKSGV